MDSGLMSIGGSGNEVMCNSPRTGICKRFLASRFHRLIEALAEPES